MKSQYKETKNYIHNELGLTKKDIQDMMKEMIHEEAVKIATGNRSVSEVISPLIERRLYHLVDKATVGDCIGELLAKKYDVVIIDKGKSVEEDKYKRLFCGLFELVVQHYNDNTLLDIWNMESVGEYAGAYDEATKS